MLTFRRLSFIAALVVSACAPALAQTQMQVVSGEGCGCCGEWVKHLLSSGYTAKVTIVPQNKLMTYKDEHGLKPEQTSCHTGTIGLTVPGMVHGSPGMGPASEAEPYQVLLLKKDGTTSVYASYP